MTTHLKERIEKIIGDGLPGVFFERGVYTEMADEILLLIHKELKKNKPKKFTEGNSFEVERNPYGEGQVSGRNGAISEFTKMINKVLGK